MPDVRGIDSDSDGALSEQERNYGVRLKSVASNAWLNYSNSPYRISSIAMALALACQCRPHRSEIGVSSR